MRDRDRFRGCLIGGAAGDALGYPVEFMEAEEIFRRYGEGGIRAYELTDGQALISDDTQMTLFTAAGLLAAPSFERAPEAINTCYLDWLRTQLVPFQAAAGKGSTWLSGVADLYSRRAPGNTCMNALDNGGGGSPEAPVTHSKGCGGVMRVAPIGLYFHDRGLPVEQIDRLAAHAAALTHGHPLGYLPATALAHIVHRVSQDGMAIRDAAEEAVAAVDSIWASVPLRAPFLDLMRKALDLARQGGDALKDIFTLGEGWTGDEALAIAVYCAARWPDDPERAVAAAVNHSGDSDSTGAIAGNIVGASVGLSGLPAWFTERLELRDVILEIADDLWRDSPEDAACKYRR